MDVVVVVNYLCLGGLTKLLLLLAMNFLVFFCSFFIFYFLFMIDYEKKKQNQRIFVSLCVCLCFPPEVPISDCFQIKNSSLRKCIYSTNMEEEGTLLCQCIMDVIYDFTNALSLPHKRTNVKPSQKTNKYEVKI